MTQRDEVAELCQTVAGAVEAGIPSDAELELTDGRFRYRPTLQAGALELVPVGRLRLRSTTRRYDVALVYEPIPLVHLALAALLRARGTIVIHQPINMLSMSYQSNPWLAPRSWWFRRARPLAVAATRIGWRLVADGFVCLSHQEIHDSGFPADQCRVLRWPSPPTGLAAATFESSRAGPPTTADAPIAFVNRFDWHRKGYDRVCAWLERYEDDLPRPAVLLCAPASAVTPQRLERLVAEGLVEWNKEATGGALYDELTRCRGLLLLSRYDGQSRVLREAALAGLPTVSTPESHFEEMVTDLGCGVIVDGDDPASVHRGFEAVAIQSSSVEVARKVLDRVAIGTELLHILHDFLDRGDRRRSKR